MAPRGRRRAFDRDAALERAMHVFWEHGYDGASLAELTAAMEIGSPSLYAAFGNKEALFRAAVDLYGTTAGGRTARALAVEPTARTAIEAMLRGNAEDYTSPGRPPGCLLVLGAGNCTDRSIRDFLAERRARGRELVAHRLHQAVDEGELPVGVDVDSMATFYVAVLQSLSLQARDGATPAQMTAIVEGALSAWDGYLRTAADPPSQADVTP